MLKLFSGNKKNKELEAIIAQLESNMANNYKDAAQSDFKNLEEKYNSMVAANKLSEKQRDSYKILIDEYKEKLKKYSHKDQKPYWTK